jgi:hypothetical protein
MHRCHALKVSSDHAPSHGKPEGGAEQCHRDRRSRGEDHEHLDRLSRVGYGREKQQHEPARTADAVHQTNAVRSNRGARPNRVSMTVCDPFSVRVDVGVDSPATVGVGVGMEETTPPPQQQPRGEEYDKRADQGFRSLLYKVG